MNLPAIGDRIAIELVDGGRLYGTVVGIETDGDSWTVELVSDPDDVRRMMSDE